MSKIKHICAECKGTDVVVDAWAEWDIVLQDWVLRSVFDDAYCITCENACDLEEIDLTAIEEREHMNEDEKKAFEVVLGWIKENEA